MKKMLFALFLFCGASVVAAGEELDVKLVYPAQAADTEALDSSTPAKRVVPPVLEETEVDPVTPLGQIRTVLNSLAGVESAQSKIMEDVASLRRQLASAPKATDVSSALEKVFPPNFDVRNLASKNDFESIRAALINVSQERTTIIEAINKLAKAQAKNAVKSKLFDVGVAVILILVLMQVVARVGGKAIEAWRAAIRRRNEEIMKAALETVEARKSAGTTDKTAQERSDNE